MVTDKSLLTAIVADTTTDKFAKEIYEKLNNSAIGEVRNIHEQFVFRDGFLF
jgi:hypothetical protein